MLTRILKDNGLLSLLLAMLAGIGMLAFRIAVTGHSATVTDMLAPHWLFGWCGNWPLVTQLISASMILASGWVARLVAVRFGIHVSKGWLVVPVTVSLWLLSRSVLLRPDIVASALLAQFIVLLLLSTYRQDRALDTLFHAGMLAGIAFLLNGPALLLIPLVFFGIFTIRPGEWREWAMPVLGILQLGVFVALILVWLPAPSEALRRMVMSVWPVSVGMSAPHPGYVVVGIILLLAIPSVLQDIAGGKMQTRNALLMLFALAVIPLLMMLGLGVPPTDALVFASMPMAIITTMQVESTTKWWWADPILILLLTVWLFA